MQRPALDVLTPFSRSATLPDSVFVTPLIPADFALIFGCQCPLTTAAMAVQAHTLYQAGYAPKFLVSGGNLNTHGLLEADYIAGVMHELGVPKDVIFTERASTNTYENAKFSRELAPSFGLPLDAKIILINRRHASLRGAMTMAAQWPESLCMTAPVSLSPARDAELSAREMMKIPEYRARGDIADINRAQVIRSIRLAQRADTQTQRPGITPRALPLAS